MVAAFVVDVINVTRNLKTEKVYTSSHMTYSVMGIHYIPLWSVFKPPETLIEVCILVT